jgi:3-isopropylmalate/(R)-2-methylmalate dehydratase large subunit
MADHYAPTRVGTLQHIVDDERRGLVQKLIQFTGAQGVPMFALDDARHGIVHVTGPEQGLSLPGMIIVCGDSHTSTHGAFGAFAFGIGSSEVTHVLATQTTWQTRPRTMRVCIDGEIPPGVTAKDVILSVVSGIGVAGAAGHIIEYAGSVIDTLSMEGRMTLCNMSIEAGARAGLIAPDTKTIDYLRGRPFAPRGAAWDAQVAAWQLLRSDPGARFARTVRFDAARFEPMVSWGTSPAETAGIDARVPDPAEVDDPLQRRRLQRALEYMGLDAGTPIRGLPVDRVFIGSCTNGRLEDLRLAASVVHGRRAQVPAIVVPGSRAVKLAAQAEGLDKIFIQAGFEWREPGCSMCLAINGDEGLPGEHCASTSNRNFVGRQGRGVRTHLMNPGMAAAAAIEGCIVDYRELPRDASRHQN